MRQAIQWISTARNALRTDRRPLRKPRLLLLLCAVSLMGGVGLPGFSFAETVPFADLEIRYNETPFSLDGGTMTWKGKTTIPLTRDTTTQLIKGEGSFSYTYEAKADGCTSTCQATSALKINSKAGIGLIELAVSEKATTAKCTVRCPRGGAQAMDQRTDGFTDRVKVSLADPAPVSRQAVTPGPTLYYTLLSDCPSQGEATGPLSVAVKPGAGHWLVTTLGLTSVDAIRRGEGGKRQQAPNPNRIALTVHSWSPESVNPVVKTVKARSGGVCYWVERVEQTMSAIEVLLPGLTWDAKSCEYRASSEHENKHVADAKSKLNQYSRDWVSSIQQLNLPRANKPAKAASAEAATADVMARIEQVNTTLTGKWAEKFAASRDNIDSKAENDRVGASCPRGWREPR